MTSRSRIVSCLIVLVVAAGCASTAVTQREVLVREKIARPDRILVYDFVATPADAPAGALAQQGTPQTAEEIETGRKLGVMMAQELAADIQGMGLPAEEVPITASPQVGDIVIKGYLVSVEEGSTGKRFLIGFRSGKSELQTMVEGYQMTAQGLRKIGSGTVEAGGSRMPGAAVPAGVAIATGNPIGLIVVGGMKIYGEASGRSGLEGRAKQTVKKIADQLKIRFQQEGWI